LATKWEIDGAQVEGFEEDLLLEIGVVDEKERAQILYVTQRLTSDRLRILPPDTLAGMKDFFEKSAGGMWKGVCCKRCC
jgi:hypothetical protein